MVTAINGNCNAADSISITVLPSPVIITSGDITISIGNSATLTVSGAIKYSWSPVNDISCIDCSSPIVTPTGIGGQSSITFTVTGSNKTCTDTSTITVYVDLTCGEIFIADAFFPTNHGNNDIIYVHGNCIKSLSFKVFDRWGILVFDNNDKAHGWDGATNNGKELNTGVYVYLVEAILLDGQVVKKSGNVSLIR